ncbi:MAG: NAD-dependent DNA ligase LigA [Spirochaetaceae bacterium]|jgi:DNA ligase (NAD+)|nr:NAD-dependent DNA ligase LigA [Spirochaetaceae bacterium]
MKNKKRIIELENLIIRHQILYYGGEAEISDAEFDALWDELKKIAPQSPVLERVGSEFPAFNGGKMENTERDADGFPKARHIIPMGSQEKAANEEEFRVWAEKTAAAQFVVQHKLDGASLELQYQKGLLQKAVTRGDGLIGDQITSNALKMNGVIANLNCGFTGGVRGEVVMTREIWKTKYKDKANCRNAANGLMRRKNGDECENLMFISYDAAKPEDEAFFTDENQKIEWLKEKGFYTPPSLIFDSAEKIIEYRNETAENRDSIPYDIDGIVVKDLVTDSEDLRKNRPEKQIAFKFSLLEAVSVLREVEWSESGCTYTPIGIVDPVRISGTTVKRANLNNPASIRALGLKIGLPVIIVKRGEIIPKIEGLAQEYLEKYTHSKDVREIENPSVCLSCGAQLKDEGTRLYCPNTSCPKRILHRLQKWASVMDIQEAGEKLIEQLFKKGRVRSIHDLYTLETEELAGYDRMGEVSAAKVIRNIRAVGEVSLSRFAAGFDLEGVGELIFEKAVEAGFDALEKLREAEEDALAQAYGIGSVTAKTIKDGLLETKEDMDATLALGFVKIKKPKEGGESERLKGLSFCFTGELKKLKRSEAENLARRNGGLVKSSVVKDLSFLVTNTPLSGSSKNKKAQKLNVKIISEEEFFSKIEEGGKKPLNNNGEA